MIAAPYGCIGKSEELQLIEPNPAPNRIERQKWCQSVGEKSDDIGTVVVRETGPSSAQMESEYKGSVKDIARQSDYE